MFDFYSGLIVGLFTMFVFWVVSQRVSKNSAKRRDKIKEERENQIREDLLDYLAYHCYKDVKIDKKFKSEEEWVRKLRMSYINSYAEHPQGKGAMARQRLGMYKFAQEYDGGRDWRAQMKKGYFKE